MHCGKTHNPHQKKNNTEYYEHVSPPMRLCLIPFARLHMQTSRLAVEDLLNLSHFLLHFSSDLFVLTFRCQGRIICSLAGFLFSFALKFVKLTFCLILRA